MTGGGVRLERVVRVGACRALTELKRRRPLTAGEYERLRAMLPDVGLGGARFDDASRVEVLVVPAEPRVVVLSAEPRRVSVGLLLGGRRLVGVVGGAELESACVGHPGGVVFAVGNLEEKRKGGRTYLDLRPRGWLLVEGAEGGSVGGAGSSAGEED